MFKTYITLVITSLIQKNITLYLLSYCVQQKCLQSKNVAKQNLSGARHKYLALANMLGVY